MKNMMKYAAGALAIGMALGSSACVVFVDDEPPRCGDSQEWEGHGDHASWGWSDEDDECDGSGWADANNEYGWNNEGGSNNEGDDRYGGGGSGDDGTTGAGDDGTTGAGDDGTTGAGDDGGTDGHEPGADDCPVEGQVCGEDGETYESACDASRAHVRVASEGPCLPQCAEDLDCADGSLCEAGSCHEVTCPELAEDDHSLEVCAEDGFTYQTECEARMARLSVAHEGCCVE